MRSLSVSYFRLFDTLMPLVIPSVFVIFLFFVIDSDRICLGDKGAGAFPTRREGLSRCSCLYVHTHIYMKRTSALGVSYESFLICACVYVRRMDFGRKRFIYHACV